MSRISSFVLCFLFCTAVLGAHAQVSPSAYRGQISLTAGGIGSGFQPDYAGGGIPSSAPNWIFGFGAYADLKMTRWIGVEGELRWMRLNSYANITQDNYLIGPKVPIHEFKRYNLTPYGKALFGIGSMNFEYNEAHGRFANIALGGGIDMKMSNHWVLRPVDFEYQLWPNWLDGTLKPYGLSTGIAYKIF